MSYCLETVTSQRSRVTGLHDGCVLQRFSTHAAAIASDCIEETDCLATGHSIEGSPQENGKPIINTAIDCIL